MALSDVLGRLMGDNKEMNSASDQDPEDIRLCGFIKDKVETTRNSGTRLAQESVWMTNVAYFMGFDSIAYDSTTKQFRSTDNSARYLRRNRIHANKILPTIQNRLARLCKNPPRYDVRPNSSSQDDRDAARLSSQVLGMIWDKERINQKRLNLYMIMQQYGYAFGKVSWDTQKGRQITDPETGETMYEGDVRFESVGPLGVFADPLAKTMEEVTWLVHAKIRKIDYFRKYYPEKGKLVKPEMAWLMSLQYEARINALSQAAGIGTNIQQQMEDAAIELAYYEIPSDKHPNGRFVVVANGVKLEDKELPCATIPFVKFDDVLVGDRFASESIITHLRPLQDQYNRTLRKRAEWVNRILAGKYVVPKGHGMSAETFNDQSGEIVEYSPQPGAVRGGEPMPLQTPVIPQYAYEEGKAIMEDMYDVAGINEISRGQLPAAGIPAIGMQFLMEQDDTRVGVVTESNEFSWADVGNLILQYVEMNYKTPRLLKIAGRNMEYTVKEFQGTDLRGNNDVTVIRGSTIPGSKVLRRQEILNTYSQGLLGDPTDPKLREKVLSMLEYGDVQEMWTDLAADMGQIKRYEDMIEQEEMPPVNELDNHPLFITELNNYRKTEKYDELTPKGKNIFDAFIQAHIQELVKIANPNMEQNNKLMMNMAQESQNMAQQGQQQPSGGAPQVSQLPPIQRG